MASGKATSFNAEKKQTRFEFFNEFKYQFKLMEKYFQYSFSIDEVASKVPCAWMYVYREHPRLLTVIRNLMGGTRGYVELTRNEHFSIFSFCDSHRSEILEGLKSPDASSDEVLVQVEDVKPEVISVAVEEVSDLSSFSSTLVKTCDRFATLESHSFDGSSDSILRTLDEIPSHHSGHETVVCVDKDIGRSDVELLLHHVTAKSTCSRKPVFDLVVYAPPASGKTTFVERVRRKGRHIVDTDDWSNYEHQSSICITNIPAMMKFGCEAIAVIPSPQEFIRRCNKRNLRHEATWYGDILRFSQWAKLVVMTDKHLSSIFRLQFVMSRLGGICRSEEDISALSLE